MSWYDRLFRRAGIASVEASVKLTFANGGLESFEPKIRIDTEPNRLIGNKVSLKYLDTNGTPVLSTPIGTIYGKVTEGKLRKFAAICLPK